MKKRLFSGLLSLCMLLSMLPVSALAVEEPVGPVSVQFSESEIIDLGTIETSAVSSLFSTRENSSYLAAGNHADWIDRLNTTNAAYAKELYDWLVAQSRSASGMLATVTDNSHPVYTYTGSVKISVPSSSYSDDSVNAALTNALANDSTYQSYIKNGSEYTKILTYIRAAYDAFDRDHPEVFWLSGKTSAGSSIASGTKWDWEQDTNGYLAADSEGNYNATVYYEIAYSFTLTSTNFDIRNEMFRTTDAIQKGITARDNAVTAIKNGITYTDPGDIVYALDAKLTEINNYNHDAVASGWDKTNQLPWKCLSGLDASIDGNAAVEPVCEGYSRAFKVLCDSYGIPCVLVDGQARTSGDENATVGPHMWNYVQVDNKWYGVDVTWDDPGTGGHECQDYVLVGADTVISGQNFIESHPVTNCASDGGIQFTNGPTLNATKYVHLETLTKDSFEYTVPEDAVYDKDKTVTPAVNYKNDITGTTGTLTVTYKDASGNVVQSPKNAGTYGVYVSAPETDDYNALTNLYLFDFTIAKQQIVITSGGDKTVTVGKTVNLGATATDDQSMTYTSEDTNIATVDTDGTVHGVKEGTTTITINADGDNNYKAASQVTVQVKVTTLPTQEGLKFTHATVTVTYGDTVADNHNPIIGGSIETNTYENYTSSKPEVATVDAGGKVTIVGAGTTTISVTARGTSEYAPTTISYTLTVEAKPLTERDFDGIANPEITKVFDGTIDCDLTEITLDKIGKVTGNAQYDKPTVEGAKAVTFYVTGVANKNYTLPSTTLKKDFAASITARPITVTAAAKTKTYGSADPELTYTVSPALITGDQFTGSLTRDAGDNVGTYAITQDTLTAGANYNVTFKGANLTISPASYTFTLPAGMNTTVKQGSSYPAESAVTADGVNGEKVNGKLSWGTGTFDQAGTKTLTWSFTPDAGQTNYVSTTQTGSTTFTVEARTLSAIAVTTPPAKTSYVYGESFDKTGMVITATYDDGTSDDVTNQVTITPETLTVATDKVTVAFGGKSVEISITVTAKPLSTTGIAWDTSGSPFTYDKTVKSVTLTGSIPEELDVNKTGDSATNAGTYTATATFALKSGLDASNYNLDAVQNVTASWTIDPATLTAADYTKKVKYDNTTEQTVTAADFGISQSGTFALKTGASVSDSSSILSGAPTYGANVAFTLASIETFNSQTAAIPVTFTPADSNYAPIDLTLTVQLTDKDIPVVSVKSFSKPYDATAVAADDIDTTASVEGTWAFKASVAAPKNVADSGTYVLVFTPAEADQYETVEINVTITITKGTPSFTEPTGLKIDSGKALSTVTLPAGWAWKDGTTVVTSTGTFPAVFTPSDTENYNTVERNLTVTVNSTTPTTPTNPTTPSRPSGSGSSSSGGGSSSTGSTSSGIVSTGSATQNGDRITQTTAKPSSTVSNGTATSTVSPDTGKQIVDQAVKNGSDTVTIVPEIRGNVSSTEVTIPSSTVSDLGRRTDADVVVDTPVAQVTIPNSALSSLSRGDLTVSAERMGNTLTVTVQSGSQTVRTVNGGLTVTAPASAAASGTVAVLVNSDGSREIIRKSAVVGGEINIPLDGSATVEIVNNSKSFADVSASSWASAAVAFASSHELFSGTSANTFSPDMNMTRGMLAVVLHNLENNPGSSYAANFSDVDSSAYYADAIAWASARGIVSGYGNGLFGANDSITREQLAVMLYRAAGSPRVSSTPTSRFNDASSISGYAETAMDWAVENGIINGIGGGMLDPQGQATRAQVAQMLKNYVESWF